MADEWRRYIYLGLEPDGYHFVIPNPNAPGVPGRGRRVTVPMNFDPLVATQELYNAAAYWQLREQWRAESTEALEALYAKWLPRRDAVLGKEAHLGKSKAEWERFYLALADEVAARQHAAGRVGAAFGLDGRALLKALMGQQGAGVAG